MKIEIEVPDEIVRVLKEYGDVKEIIQEWAMDGIKARSTNLTVRELIENE